MRQLLRMLLLGVFVVLLFGAINGHHVHPAKAEPAAGHQMSGHQLAGHHAAMLAALQAPAAPSTAPSVAPDDPGNEGHMLLRLCLAALAGAIGLVVWLFARGAVHGRLTHAPVFSRPPPRPAARSRPPTGRVLAQLCVLRT